ncbi:unnamed protein product [Medioppia subpectinata]|uniref:Uncharacterized protein n=1 Tax=Medioppia subpectinata TaxID=1979941 RepID=A0A7R9LRZ4_9ACAR|nr:unnamed protein product [Medioppia subpectinata]CAG2121198.1 unnamed protein product [Medioppia subpectinata]
MPLRSPGISIIVFKIIYFLVPNIMNPDINEW